MKLLEAKELTVSLGNRDILQKVNFEIRKGEVVGLIGPNGAGKSTLIKTLIRVLKPKAGGIRYFEKPASEWPPKKLARKIAYLPQGQTLHWPLTVERLVSLGRIPYLAPWQSLAGEDHAAIREAMRETDCDHLAGRSVNQLAGGEKTLVMLARALAVRPEIFLADEPVAGLDPGHQIQVMELFRELAAKGVGIVVVLHHLTLASRFCDRLYLLHEGKVSASGTAREVLAQEHLARTYGVQAKIGNDHNDFYVIPWKRL